MSQMLKTIVLESLALSCNTFIFQYFSTFQDTAEPKSIVKSQEILKSEDDHSGRGVQKARKIKFSPLKNPTSISDDIAKNSALTKIQLDEEEIVDFSAVKSQEILKSEE